MYFLASLLLQLAQGFDEVDLASRLEGVDEVEDHINAVVQDSLQYSSLVLRVEGEGLGAILSHRLGLLVGPDESVQLVI